MSDLFTPPPELVAAALRTTHLAMMVWEINDGQVRVLDWNTAAERMFGRKREDVLGRDFRAFLPAPEFRVHTDEMVRTLTLSQEPVDTLAQCMNARGDVLNVEWFCAASRDELTGQIVVLSLADDVTDRLAAEEELAHYRHELEAMVGARTAQLSEANRLLQEATSAKSRFLANMSHELRTPLNSIIGFTGIMLQGLVGELTSEQNAQIAMVNRSGHQLLALINDVLDVARIEAGRVAIVPVDVEIAPLVEEIAAMLRPAAEERGLRLVVTIHDGMPPLVRTDRDRLGQILLNLVSNAVKFTEQGSVHIDVRSRHEDLVFAVTDTGIGIPAGETEGIFEAFHQLEARGGLSPDGTGLGLAISRELAALLGGTLVVASTVGAGSTFTLLIPSTPIEPRKQTS